MVDSEDNAYLDTGLGEGLEEDLSVDSEHGASLLGLCDDIFDSIAQKLPLQNYLRVEYYQLLISRNTKR